MENIENKSNDGPSVRVEIVSMHQREKEHLLDVVVCHATNLWTIENLFHYYGIIVIYVVDIVI